MPKAPKATKETEETLVLLANAVCQVREGSQVPRDTTEARVVQEIAAQSASRATLETSASEASLASRATTAARACQVFQRASL